MKRNAASTSQRTCDRVGSPGRLFQNAASDQGHKAKTSFLALGCGREAFRATPQVASTLPDCLNSVQRTVVDISWAGMWSHFRDQKMLQEHNRRD